MSDVEVKEIPENWEKVKLGDIVNIVYGKNLPKKDLHEEGYPVYGANGIIGKYERYLYEDEQVLISCRGAYSGKANMSPPYAYITNNSLILETPENGGLNKKYLYYWLNIADKSTLVTGSAQPQVTINNAIDLSVPLAPPEQQKRIVAKIEELFSHIDAGIEALKKAKQLLKQYRQSVLKAAVTGELTKKWREVNKDKLEPASQLLERILKERRQKWEEQQLEKFKAKGKTPKDDKWKEKYKEQIAYEGTPLFELPEEWCWAYMGQLGDVIGGLTKNKKREQLKQQLPYLRVANVYANELRLDDVTQIGMQDSELERVLLEKGDLLIVEGNGSPEQIGRLAVWDGSISPCVHQNHLIKVRLQEKDCGNFLMYWLSSLGGRDVILQVASSTSGLYTLSISKVSGLPIPMPPIEEQFEIQNFVSSKLSSIEHFEAEIDIQLIKAEQNKQSILASVFSGRIN